MKQKRKIDYFLELDELLSEEDKKFIVEDDDATISLHFSLGQWIRNNWIYSKSSEEVEQLTKLFYPKRSLMYIPYSPDDLSEKILTGYQKYLRKRYVSKLQS